MAIFDPAMFGLLARSMAGGAPSGGLLDFLRDPSRLGAMSPSAGFGEGALPSNAQPAQGQMNLMPDRHIPVGDYQMPQFGNPAPQAPMQANAQMQQAPSPDLGGRLSAGLEGFTSGPGMLSKLSGLAQGLSTGQSPVNQTQQALIQRGFDPVIAQQVARNPELLRAVLPQLMGTSGQTDDIKEYQFAKREDPSLTFDKFMQRKRAVSGEFGMQPIWGTGPDGKPAVLQLGKSGEAKQSVLPQGFNLSRDPVKVEGPTGTAILDPQTRQQVAFIPKDVAGAAKAKEIGEAEGTATVNLPSIIATSEQALKTIKQLKDHEGKKNWGAFGWGAVLPDAPNSSTRGFGALVDQVKGQNFMTAFQSLKGAGAITEQEGAKAERAQARLDRLQSEGDFDQAIKDLEEVVMAGMERARQKAGIRNNQPSPTAATPAADPLGLR